jgi:hypothetical protein
VPSSSSAALWAVQKETPAMTEALLGVWILASTVTAAVLAMPKSGSVMGGGCFVDVKSADHGVGGTFGDVKK